MKFILLIFIILFVNAYGAFSDHLKKVENKTPVQTIAGIDYMYVINLDHRKEKYQYTLEQLFPYGIIPYRFSAINAWKLPLEAIWDVSLVFEKGMRPGGMGTVYRRHNGREYHSHEIVEIEGTPYVCHCMARGAFGCILSHLSVMQDALNEGYEIVWICEDDIEVVRNPHILSAYIKELDRIVGRKNWDLLFTFSDYRGPDGKYCKAYGGNYRPNIDTRNQEKFNINKPISQNLRQVGSRFGTQSMIWTRNGIKKALDYYNKYKIFVPYDLDIVLIPGIKIYSVIDDVVTNKLDSVSDLGSTVTNNE